jgi:HD-GYP domain-containing protein (c-di-GMP phosphodiesterase class II)
MPDERAGQAGEEASIPAAQETAERLAGAIEAHEPGIDLHLIRVASTAVVLGVELGLDAGRVALLRAAAPLHDIGKIVIPVGVLRKRGALTPSERERMESHTIVGHQILANSESELLKIAATIALTHHEWFDGSGYPGELSGEEIPVEGRIVAVADVLDTLLSDCPYRLAMSEERAVDLILEERGTHFDPKVVDTLIENLDQVLALRGGGAQ